MSWLSRLTRAFRSNGVDRTIDDEHRFHIESRIDDLVAGGMPREIAKGEARRQFGNPLRYRECSRDIKLIPTVEDLLRDLRHGLRTIRRSPIVAAVIAVTLGIAIGANTVIFSIVDGVLLRPLRYPQPDQLMYFSTTTNGRETPVSVPEYLEFQQFTQSLSVGAFRLADVNLATHDQAIRAQAAVVDAALLRVLGVQVADGRLLSDADSDVTAPPLPGGSAVAQPVALVSYELWQSAFGGDSIVGTGVEIDGRRVQIVGIMARGSDLMDRRTDLWLPLGFTDDERRARNNHNLMVIGRLRQGASQVSAGTDLSTLMDTWSARTGIRPGSGHDGHVFLPATTERQSHALHMVPLKDQILGRVGRSIWVLQGAVGLLLLIACANVVNLLFARAETRRREFALLEALGASRVRLVRKAIIEGLILASIGGALGILLAGAGLTALIQTHPNSLPRIGEVRLDGRVLLASLSVSVLCGCILGLAAVFRRRGRPLSETLNAEGRGSSQAGRDSFQRALVVTEVALAVVVLVVAGLLLRTVENLTRVDAGFERNRLLTFSVTLPRPAFNNLARIRGYQEVLERLRAVPGITGASAMSSLPLNRQYLANQTEISNNALTPGLPIPIDYVRVMSTFFETMGIPITEGRGFASSDTTSELKVAVVNEALANSYWKGRTAVGQQLRPAGTTQWFTVIGVAKDVRQSGVDQPVQPEAYVFVDQLTSAPSSWVAISPTTMHVVVRSALPLNTLVPAFGAAVQRVAPNVPPAELREMGQVFNESIRRPRLLAQVLALFSAVALLLAAIGVYGVLSFMVTQRRRELAVHLALGADRGRLIRDVLVQGLTPAATGVGIGILSALLVSRALTFLLFEVEAADRLTLVATIATMAGVASAACWLPAWRASRLDPNLLLQGE